MTGLALRLTSGSLDEAPRWQRRQALWTARAQLAELRTYAWATRRVRAFLAFRSAMHILDGMLEKQARRK